MRKLIILLFCSFLFFYLIFVSGHMGADGFDMYLVAESIVLDHDISILSGERTFRVPELERGAKVLGIKGRDDKLYSRYGIGLPLIEAPFYLLGHKIAQKFNLKLHDYITMLFVSFVNCPITAFIGIIVFLFAFGLFSDYRAALFSSLLFCIGSFAMPQIKYGYSEPLLALCFLMCIYLSYLYSTKGERKYLFYSCAFFGYALLTKYYVIIFLPLVLIFQLYFCLKPKGKTQKEALLDIISMAAPILVSFLLLAIYNYWRFENIFQSGYGDMSIFSVVRFKDGLIGQLFSPGKSLFLYFPATVLAFFAVKNIYKKYQKLMLLFCLIVIINILFYSLIKFWHGDLGWGLRYQYLILPLISIVAGYFFTRGLNLKVLALAKTILALGFLINLPPLLINMADWRYFVGRIPGVNVYFNPLFSSILGGWIQLASFITRIVTGRSLSLVVYGTKYSLSGYDRLDMWFTTILSRNDVGIIIKVLTLMALIFIFCSFIVFVVSFKKEYMNLQRGRISE